MVGSTLCSAQFFRAERSSYDVSLVLCFVDFVVVYGLVRKAPSLSSPVDIASLAWPFRDEQSSYDVPSPRQHGATVSPQRFSDVRSTLSPNADGVW